MGFKRRSHHPRPVGRLFAPNASCWCVICDAGDAAAWNGDDGFDYQRPLIEYLAKAPSDFARAMRTNERRSAELTVGEGTGVVATLSTSGSSHIWRYDRGIGALEYFPSGELEDEPSADALTERFAGIPTTGRPKRLGTFDVRCGVVAMFLPFTSGPFADDLIRTAAGQDKAVEAGDFRLLLSMPRGRYTVFVDRLGQGLGYEDELGAFPMRVRVERD